MIYIAFLILSQGSSSGAAKPASKVAKKESGDDDDSSEESSGSDEENDRQVSVANSKKNEVWFECVFAVLIFLIFDGRLTSALTLFGAAKNCCQQ